MPQIALLLSALPAGLLLLTSGCHIPTSEAQSRRGAPPGAVESDLPIAVQTVQAKVGSPQTALTYTGTTRPLRQVAVRAQGAGKIVSLRVDVGDIVGAEQILAQLDGDTQTASVNQAQAELSARRAEAAQTEVAIAAAQTAVVQAQAQLNQSQTDAERLRQLAS